ncbi:MAG: cardiolipin synthase [Clostridia bacterium]|nr:cardiolipin synthase [Clostridia bacterium]
MIRAILILFSIAVQIAVFVFGLIIFSDKYVLFQMFMLILSIFIVIAIVSRTRNPGNKVLWIVLILAFPILGTALYLILGHNLYRSKRLKLLFLNTNISKEYLTQDDEVLQEIKSKDANVYSEVNYISNFAGYPIYKSNKITYYKTGEEVYEKMKEDIKKAEKYIFLEYFTISEGVMWQELLSILDKKSKEGVDIRIIYDDIGSAALLPKNFNKTLKEKGIKTLCFNRLKPVVSTILNNRDHRKITVVDGKVAYCGGINIADEYINKKVRYGYWKDCMVKVEGDAVISFTSMFFEIWNTYYEDEYSLDEYKYNFEKTENIKGYVCPYAENPLDSENVGENIYINMLNKANDYVYIFTPYLIPDTDLITALTLSAKRGVDVRIVLPGIPDKKIIYSISRSYYKVLLGSGVKIYEYMPGFLHSKVLIADDKKAVVGTFNLDYRSLYTHFECGTYIYDSDVIESIKNDAMETFEISKVVGMNDIKTSIFRNLLNAFLRLFAPLL